MSGLFKVGDRVCISSRSEPRHHRVPSYAKGCCGKVQMLCGDFAQPETLSERESGEPLVQLYRVRLQMSEVWPDYRGPLHDTLDLEIYEHWLQAEEDDG